MWNPIRLLFARPKSTKPHRRTTVLRLESLEKRDTPAALGFDDFSRASRTDGHPPAKEIQYEVSIESNSHSKVIKQIAKKNTLALKDLGPGNYSVGQNVHATPGDRVIARR